MSTKSASAQVHKGCPTCKCGDPASIPTEPAVGTWVRDRFGGTSMHHKGGGWAPPGFMPFGKWEAMWIARGPLVECEPWGAESAPRSGAQS